MTDRVPDDSSKPEPAVHEIRYEYTPNLPEILTHLNASLPRSSFSTGAIHGHNLAWGRDGLWIVNTLFSCLCTLHDQFSFVPRWRPR